MPTVLAPICVRSTTFGRSLAIAAILNAPSAFAQQAAVVRASTAVSPTLTIEYVLRSAMTQHPLVEAAEARVRAARGSRLTAGALPNPIFTYQVENAPFPGRQPAAGLERETQTYATLPLEPLWQRWPRVSRANEDVRGANAELELARRVVALDAARAFYRIALAQVAFRGALDIQQGLDSLVRFNRARVAEGVAAEGDLIRVEVESARTATDAALQEVELVRARAELLPFLDDTTRAKASVLAVAVTDDSAVRAATELPAFADLASGALSARPDVLSARARARASVREVQYQRTLGVRHLGATFGSKASAGTTSMIAGISLPIPLFDQNRGAVQRASGERTAAERELAWIERRASADLAGAYEAARILEQQVARLEQGFLKRAEEARRIALAAYQEGAAPLLQVIDATRTLAEARLTYYRALFARREGLLDLYNAAGLDLLDAFLPAKRTSRVGDPSTTITGTSR